MAALTVPGDVAAIRADAERWRRVGELLEAARADLAALDPEWDGPAARAFRGYLDRTGPGWTAASDACHAAARAVSTYADTLEWAQREAVDAPESEHERIQAQVAAAGDDAVLAIGDADGQAPTTMAGNTGTKWDDVESDHPDPSTIRSGHKKTHINWGDHRGGGHHWDSGVPGKTVFPEEWDENDIMDVVDDVAKNPDQPPVRQDNDNWRAEGTRDGVRVVVIVDEDGDVVTAYPEYGKGVGRNDDEGEPQLLSPEENGGHHEEVDIAEEEEAAEEAESHAEEAEERAEDHEDAADEAEDAGDEQAASEHGAAAESARDEAETSRMVADQHRERADRAHDADEEASSWWKF